MAAPHPNLQRSSSAPRDSGFTLVEVALALAVVAFAFVSLFALLPHGMTTFHRAMDTSVAAHLVQRIVADAQESDFETLLASSVAKGGEGDQFYTLPLRHFDEQGNETADPSIYAVRVRGSLPGPANSAAPSSANFTLLPTTSEQRFHPRDMTFLTIQIARNPGHRPLEIDESTFLWKRPDATTQIDVRTFSTVVARNGFSPAKSTPKP